MGCLGDDEDDGNGDEDGDDGEELLEFKLEISMPYDQQDITLEAARAFEEKVDEASDGQFSISITLGGA